MCGRFTLYHPLNLLFDRFGISFFQKGTVYDERYNIAPSQPVLSVVSDGKSKRLGYLKWGLVPFWAKDPSIGNKLINARAETLAEKPSFKYALQSKRCLILADGFYEWKIESDRKVPTYIRLKNHTPFAFAGLWERWKERNGQEMTSCTIITTKPNSLISSIHDRMPVILQPENESTWLDPNTSIDQLQSILAPYPAELMEAYSVSSQVNSPAVDHPTCIQPV